MGASPINDIRKQADATLTRKCNRRSGDSGGPKFALSSTPVFSKSRLDQDEGDLFGEKPPDDLHRQNIVNPLRTHVGIGLSLALQGEDFRDSCSQEFVNHYGEYSQIRKLFGGAKNSRSRANC